MLFDFRFLNTQVEKPAAPEAAHWTRYADKITRTDNEKALYLLVQAVTTQYLVLELHMLYADQDRHTLTLKLIPNATEAPVPVLAGTGKIPGPVRPSYSN
ncbi:hypothetical protein HMJ29_06435 [Hymenobacter taeanensis]|uniref:Uncharacterized protein n=1 Tax=Hymenobacter taeanensis TaxID=2735321 RepID=A0A6M6BFT3_9BACT|nr:MULTISPECIES: hypothetical protein [Hymenobacter]QJX46594.1 hypothetical protein HMJ29_06435 [Hymenobacter taeanensis]UOQ80454.1 hypothetical protein MUN83_16765 [Hymenobacter sp. 5414T-23]